MYTIKKYFKNNLNFVRSVKFLNDRDHRVKTLFWEGCSERLPS